MREEKVEDALREGVNARGGICVKLNPKGYKGIPDRLVLMPGPRIALVELKRPRGGVWSRAQQVWHNRLTAMGIECAVLRSVEEVKKFLDTLKAVP